MELTLLSASDPASNAVVTGAGELLARAFYDDPAGPYIIPDPQRRTDITPPILEVLVRYVLNHGRLWVATSGKDLVGVALWLPPEHPTFTEEGMFEAGIVAVAEQAGDEVMARLATVTSYPEALRQELMPLPHWYLAFLAVEPAEQGKGIGSRLIEEMLPHTQRFPCYLETFNPRNVVLYKRHGFNVIGEGDIPDGGPHFWAMRRG